MMRSPKRCGVLLCLLCALALLTTACTSAVTAAPAATPAPAPVETPIPTPSPAGCKMQDLQWETAEYAVNALEACDATVNVTYEERGDVPGGLVTSQSLSTGEDVKEGDTVTLGVSTPAPTPVPTPPPTPTPTERPKRTPAPTVVEGPPAERSEPLEEGPRVTPQPTHTPSNFRFDYDEISVNPGDCG